MNGKYGPVYVYEEFTMCKEYMPRKCMHFASSLFVCLG